MNLQEFLSHPDIQLPLCWNETDDFQGFLRQRLGHFGELISELDAGPVADALKARQPAIAKCSENIVCSVDQCLEGYLHKAYSEFEKGIQEVLDEIENYTMTLEPRHLGVLYRVRQTSDPKLRPEDLFHIPFEERHEVPTHRYSIPGLPCLYLSGSLYTCWEEMGRPPFHELQAAAFWVKDGRSVKLLNFSRPLSQLLSWVKDNDVVEPSNPSMTKKVLERQLVSSLVLWPLMASTSVIVKHRNSPFKIEYLIPQMLLQWVRNSDFDGICYFSTHVPLDSTEYPLPICNLVFPPKMIELSGRCEHLCGLFKMTEPHGWELLKAINIGGGTSGGTLSMFDFKFVGDKKEHYHETEFGMVEMRLKKLVDGIIDRNENGESDLGDIGIGR
jgi:hypothetical protein